MAVTIYSNDTNFNRQQQMNSFKYEVDRGVSDFVNIRDFVNLRLTSKIHYNDSEAWKIKTLLFPINISTLNSKEKIGLHYLLIQSCQFSEPIGSLLWYKKIVSWLQYNVSIKIMSNFMYQQRVMDFDLGGLCLRRRFIWQRQFHCKNMRLLKNNRKRKLENDWEKNDSQCPCKKIRTSLFLGDQSFQQFETY